ncbi:hypothetical protein Tco_0991378 [Tanacetum coccineum]|uniref:CCHC-type domain-containing protein n=1 Tax=Tanacetum coccineum TaxID=301880 RepID=A0ABQ5EZG6_9ASTR
MVVQNQSQLGKGSAIPTDLHHTPTIIQPLTQPQKIQQPRKPKRKDTQVPQPSDPIENVADEAVHKELGDSLVVVPGAMKPWGILLLKLDLRVYLNIPMIHYLQEKTKTTQYNEIASLKRRVKKLEKKDRSRTYRLKRLYKVGLTARVESFDNEESLGEDASKQGRIDAIDADEEIILVSVHNVNVSAGEEVFVAEQDVAEEAGRGEDPRAMMMDLESRDEIEAYGTLLKPKTFSSSLAAGDIVSTASAATTVSAATTTTATIALGRGFLCCDFLREVRVRAFFEKYLFPWRLGFQGARGVEVRLTVEIVGVVPIEGFCWFCASRDGNSSIDAPNPNSFNDPPNVFTHPPQPQYKSYSCELCGNDAHYGYDCPLWQRMNDVLKVVQSLVEKLCQQEQATNLSIHTPEPSRHFNSICYDDDDDDNDEESTIPLNEIISQITLSNAIIPVLPTMKPEDSLSMGDEHLSTIPEKESDEFIKSSVEDLVPIPSESEDTPGSDSECNDFSPINIPEGKSVTFFNPLFDLNDDFTSSDDKSLSNEDVLKDNVKIYSNPLFEFDAEYIFSDENPLFDEVLENIESKDSYVSNLDESALLVTPLSDANEDECFDPRGKIDEIDAFLNMDISTDFEDNYYDSKGDIIYLESLLIKDTIPNLPPEVFLDHEPRSLNNKPDNLKSMVKIFDLEIWEKFFSPTYVKLPFEDRHYLSLTYVIRIFLPYFTYPVDSSLPLSSGSEDTIFDPGISAFHSSSLEPVASHRSRTFMCFNVYPNILNESPMEIFSSTCFVPNITMIWGESS